MPAGGWAPVSVESPVVSLAKLQESLEVRSNPGLRSLPMVPYPPGSESAGEGYICEAVEDGELNQGIPEYKGLPRS